jgi:hypothetical protein
VLGALLGGTVGIGTALYALTIGPITHFTIPALSIDPRKHAGASSQTSSQPARRRRRRPPNPLTATRSRQSKDGLCRRRYQMPPNVVWHNKRRRHSCRS